MRYAFELARRRGPQESHQRHQVQRRCSTATSFWDEVFGPWPATTQRSTPSSATSTRWRCGWSATPSRFDVLVASNLFGDILSDLAGALVGLGWAGANVNIGEGAGLLRAGPRLGAGHRWQGHRQPDRGRLGRRR